MNLKDYIRGQRRRKEANQLERKAMEDPFLQDAIDGYDSMEADHLSGIEKLEKQLPSPKRRIDRRIWIWASAAAIILLTGIPLLLYKPYTKEGRAIVSTESPAPAFPQEKERSASLLQDDTLLVAEYSGSEKEEQKPQITKEATEGQATTPSLSGEALREAVDPVAELAETLGGRVAGVVVSGQTRGEDAVKKEKEKEKDTVQIRGLAAASAQPDKLFVSGRIVDETGEPIPGVTIHIPDTRIGTISDIDGQFQLAVSKEDQGKLIASYIGMGNIEIPPEEHAGDIVMKSDEMALNEVVVVGFGSQKKESVVGAVSALTDASITDRASAKKVAAAFGEEEFRNWFIEHYDKERCAEQKITVVVEFFVGPTGQPGNIDIKENPCPALENELKRLLLGSPPWSERDRKVTLKIELP